MIDPTQLEVIEREGRRLLALARDVPSAAVPQYPGWSLTDLAVHVGGVHGRTAAVCREHPHGRIPTTTKPPEADPFAWAESQLVDMLEALAAADPDARVWTFVADGRLVFWGRRMVVETGVHRWDAQSAVERPEPLSAVVASHGLDEFPHLYLPRLGDAPPIELRATDLARAWRYGEGAPEAIVEATASELYLRLMSRPGAALPASWEHAVDALPPPAK